MKLTRENFIKSINKIKLINFINYNDPFRLSPIESNEIPINLLKMIRGNKDVKTISNQYWY
jgi:hypothetical protein